MLTRGLTNNSWLVQILYVIMYYILYSYNKASVFFKLLQISKNCSTYLLKNICICISGLTQFKPMLFKSQLFILH